MASNGCISAVKNQGSPNISTHTSVIPQSSPVVFDCGSNGLGGMSIRVSAYRICSTYNCLLYIYLTCKVDNLLLFFQSLLIWIWLKNEHSFCIHFIFYLLYNIIYCRNILYIVIKIQNTCSKSKQNFK